MYALLLHGLGCSPRTWEDAGAGEHLPGWNLVVPRLRGDVFTQASELTDQVLQLEGEAENCGVIVGHSTGGITGLLLAGWTGVPFISVEGSFTGEDCGLLSRSLAAGSGIPDDALTRPEFDWSAWSEEELCYTARSMVAWAGSGELVPRWEGLHPRKRFYVHGDGADGTVNMHVSPRAEVASGTGHWPMLTAPEEFWTVVRNSAEEMLPW